MKDTSHYTSAIDLASARDKYLAEQEKDSPNVFVKFNYAKALTRDEKVGEQALGELVYSQVGLFVRPK